MSATRGRKYAHQIGKVKKPPKSSILGVVTNEELSLAFLKIFSVPSFEKSHSPIEQRDIRRYWNGNGSPVIAGVERVFSASGHWLHLGVTSYTLNAMGEKIPRSVC